MLAQAAKDAVFLSAHHVHLNQTRFVRHDLTIMTRPRKVFKLCDEKVHFSMILY